MKKHLTVLVLAIAIIGVLSSCSSETTSTDPRGGVLSTAESKLTAADAGRLHNAILREVDSEYTLANQDSISVSELADILADAATAVADDEDIDESFTKEDILAVFEEIDVLRAEDRYDFTGNELSNPESYIDHVYNKGYLTEDEHGEYMEMLGDSLWTLNISTLETKKGSFALAIRDSSRAFWIAEGLVNSADNFSGTIDWYSMGIVASDAVGGSLGAVVGSVVPVIGKRSTIGVMDFVGGRGLR